MQTQGGIGVSVVVSVVATVGLFFWATTADAFSIDALRQQIAERREALRARVEDHQEQEDDDPVSPNDTSSDSGEDIETSDDKAEKCECSARFKFARPDVRWQGATLQFVPRFDVSFRVKGEHGVPNWNLDLAYSGKAAEQTFSGSQQFSGQCFDGRYSYSGIAGTPVTMSNIVRSMFSHEDASRLVPLRMTANLSGCDVDEESRETEVEIEEFGNLDVNRWGRVR